MSAGLLQNAVMLEDMLCGINEWRNIQDIVRQSFKSFHDVIRAQGEAIRVLEQQVEDLRASKADRTRVEELVAEAAEATAAKVDAVEKSTAAQLEAAQKSTAAAIAAARADIAADVTAQVTRKADRALVENHVTELSQEIEGVRAQQAALARNKADAQATKVALAQLEDTKAAAAAVAADIEAARAKCFRHAETCAREASEPLEESVAALQRGAKQVAERVAADGESTAQALRAVNATLDSLDGAVVGVRERVGSCEATLARQGAAATAFDDRLRTAEAALDRKADVADVERQEAALEKHAAALAGRCDRIGAATEDHAMRLDAAERAGADAVKRLAAVEGELPQVGRAVQEVEEIRVQLGERPTSREMCTLLDAKSDAEDVNRLAVEIARELDQKASARLFEEARREQQVVNASVVGEMTVARWLWKSGRLAKGGAVPWNAQAVNTDPDNFVWERDGACIVAVVPGLYEVSFGFYAPRKPRVQLLVNGAPVLAAVNSSSYVVHHSSGRLSSIGKHPDGCVTGLTMVDFLALPAKARLTIMYKGDEQAEGFFALRKL
ncbi:unnamed protein product [Pedinophyceae sp. YPF-701]|nr:unnamed protein product [Pedinophyceae sp. YPF-701]